MRSKDNGMFWRRFELTTLVCMLFTLTMSSVCFAQTGETFSDVKARFVKDKEREMDDKDAALTLDSGARRLRVKSSPRPLDVSYDDVQKVIIEVNTFGHKAGFGASFLGMFAGGLLFGNAIATSIDKPFDNDHFVLFDYKNADGTSSQYLLNVSKNAVPQALKSLKAAFGDRVSVPVWEDKVEPIEKKTFVATRTRLRPDSTDEENLPLPKGAKTRTTATDKQHPLPAPKSDMALIVVVAPATIFDLTKPEKGFLSAPLYANNTMVSLNSPGAYTFFYLPPGECLLASETHDLIGLRMRLEAGKEYYLSQTLYSKGIRIKSFLTRHSKELVMYEIGGSLWADWSREIKTK